MTRLELEREWTGIEVVSLGHILEVETTRLPDWLDPGERVGTS